MTVRVSITLQMDASLYRQAGAVTFTAGMPQPGEVLLSLPLTKYQEQRVTLKESKDLAGIGEEKGIQF